MLENELITKFRDKGIKIEKTKSRHEVFSNVYQADPSLLIQSSSLADTWNVQADEQKIIEL